MNTFVRTTVVILIALACLAAGSGLATASSVDSIVTVAGAAPSFASTAVPPAEQAEPSAASVSSDTKGSIITAGAAGLLLGAAIAFWQSVRNRSKRDVRDEPSESADDAGD